MLSGCWQTHDPDGRTATVARPQERASGTVRVNLATAGLARTLPRSRTIEFARLDHFGMDQGDPETVAAATAHFLAQ